MEGQMGVSEERWVDAVPAAAEGAPLLGNQIESWRERGFAFVSGVLPDDLVARLADGAAGRFPEPGSDAASAVNNFGSDLTFPSTLSGFNELTLHPRLLAAVSQLLDTPIADIRLSQSDLWPKYGREERSGGIQDNMDQRIHVDYPNHTLAHPAEWDRPEAVELIVYLSDVDECGGATAVVPRDGRDDPAYPWPIVDSPGIGDLDYVNDRESAERYLADRRPEVADWRRQLYERERYVRYRTGDVLFYRHDTWHRGTPMHAGALRLVHNLTFRRAECEWISTLHVGWAWSAYRQNKFLEKLIARATLDQRAVLGFPQPGSGYWTSATIEAVAARHGVFGMDMTPYRNALEE
jgi:hypothetical protein